ncbi:MAG: phosphoribosylformylglycinamidine synthase subunit PurS [Thermomicrobiales bacterium]|jgi:phosphoribosylformylglycinamidine synthase|nr:phosphoribosylformylglycinamidine synthase subunit PurS [Thermomicrobiales bacterium]
MSNAWVAEVVVMPKAGVNDPQGEAILGGLHDLGYRAVGRVRAGKQFRVEIDADSEAAARKAIAEMSDRLLANPVIEVYEIESLTPLTGAGGER